MNGAVSKNQYEENLFPHVFGYYEIQPSHPTLFLKVQELLEFVFRRAFLCRVFSQKTERNSLYYKKTISLCTAKYNAGGGS